MQRFEGLKIEKVLNSVQFKELSNKIMSSDFSWYYNPNTVDKPIKDNIIQFTHRCKENNQIHSNFYNELNEIFKVLNRAKPFSDIERCKFNLTLPLNTQTTNTSIHQDHTEKNYYTCIIYLNDSDGDTILYNDDLKEIARITPKKNTGIIFNSTIQHKAELPTKGPRVVLNIVFKTKDDSN